jgi:hypothetical protein
VKGHYDFRERFRQITDETPSRNMIGLGLPLTGVIAIALDDLGTASTKIAMDIYANGIIELDACASMVSGGIGMETVP